MRLETKVCKGCTEEKPVTKYQKYIDYCHSCRYKTYGRSSYEKHKVKYIQAAKIKTAEQVDWYRKLKSGPCTECGNFYHQAAMHFHHKGDKTKHVSQMVYRHSRAKIQKEIDKCILLCANCHATRTWMDHGTT